MLYDLCVLKHPFASNNRGVLIIKILQGNFTPIPSSKFSNSMSELINEMLIKDYKKRPSIISILKKPSKFESNLKVVIQ